MAITIGSITRSVVRGDTLPVDTSLDELGEIAEHIQLDIDGDAGSTLAWSELDITFDVDFIDATNERYSNLPEPQFTYGAAVSTDTPVGVYACVKLPYVVDDRGVIVGATVAVAALSPGAAASFTGRVYLTFEGFGCLPNEPSDPDFSPEP